LGAKGGVPEAAACDISCSNVMPRGMRRQTITITVTPSA